MLASSGEGQRRREQGWTDVWVCDRLLCGSSADQLKTSSGQHAASVLRRRGDAPSFVGGDVDQFGGEL